MSAAGDKWKLEVYFSCCLMAKTWESESSGAILTENSAVSFFSSFFKLTNPPNAWTPLGVDF